MDQLPKVMVAAGLGIAAVGGVLWLLQSAGLRVGRLPGDLAVQRDGFSLFVPFTTTLLLSGILTLVLWLVNAARR